MSLKAGESKEISFIIDKSALSFYDVKNMEWQAEKGKIEILLGSSSRDIKIKEEFKLE